jgi:hypothetical protein
LGLKINDDGFISGLASKSLGQFSPVWSQNRWRRFFSGLSSKSVVTDSSGLVSKPAMTVSNGLGSKYAATVSFLNLKTKVVEGFSV